MRSTTKWILILLGAAVAASAAAAVLKGGGTPNPVARITRNGELLEEIALDRVTAAYSLTLEDKSGFNTVLVEPGRIRVSAADCPDQVCVRQGYISDGTAPIVCLPHGLMIEIVGGGDGFDAAAG